MQEQDLERLVRTAPSAVRSGSEEIFVPAGASVLLQGEQSRWVYLLLRGEAAGQLTGMDGELRSVFLFRAPAVIGEFELFCEQESLLAVTARTGCRLLRLPGPLFLDWLRQDFELNCILIRQLIQKVTQNAAAQEFLDRASVRQRVMRTALRWHRQGRLSLLDKPTLCAEAGAPLRSVNRALAVCREEGTLAWQEGRLQILDLARLEENAR